MASRDGCDVTAGTLNDWRLRANAVHLVSGFVGGSKRRQVIRLEYYEHILLFTATSDLGI